MTRTSKGKADARRGFAENKGVTGRRALCGGLQGGRFDSLAVLLPPAQSRLAGLGDAEAVEQPQGVVIEEAAEVLAADVEGGHRRQEDRAGVDQAPHVLDVDEAV